MKQAKFPQLPKFTNCHSCGQPLDSDKPFTVSGGVGHHGQTQLVPCADQQWANQFSKQVQQ